jgi:hypothetical protein
MVMFDVLKFLSCVHSVKAFLPMEILAVEPPVGNETFSKPEQPPKL